MAEEGEWSEVEVLGDLCFFVEENGTLGRVRWGGQTETGSIGRVRTGPDGWPGEGKGRGNPAWSIWRPTAHALGHVESHDTVLPDIPGCRSVEAAGRVGAKHMSDQPTVLFAPQSGSGVEGHSRLSSRKHRSPFG